MRICKVLLRESVRQTDKAYTYKVPEELEERIVPGSYVKVPFGFGNRIRGGGFLFGGTLCCFQRCTVAGRCDCADDCFRIRISLDTHRIGQQADGAAVNALYGADSLFDSCAAGSAAHACDMILRNQGIISVL